MKRHREEEEEEEEGDNVVIPTMERAKAESISDIHYSEELSETKRVEMSDVFSKHATILTASPGCCSLKIEHDIKTMSEEPVFRRQYPLPFSSQETIKEEVQCMLDLGVIEPSQSAYSAPVVLVQKPDGSTRFCCDYRELNKVTCTDAEPIPDTEELFTKLAKGKYFTKIDLSKGYWQIPVKREDRHKTAFQTPLGLFQWVRMPFGLVTAPATFARMMRALQLDKSAISFFDDVLIYSVEWSEHLKNVNEVLEKLKEAGLTARPKKIFAGFQELEFLGHRVGQGLLKPEEKKVEKILHIPTPTTKRQVRALLGLVGYYRRYIRDFATVTAPISDLLAGKVKKKFVWTDSCQSALEELQSRMSKSPILLLADLDKPFLVRTDASAVGIGGILMQEHDSVVHPVTFVSRKLLPRETRYSTIERECLAIVWVVKKLGRYLWGRSFVLQTDHRPLTYLMSSVFKNARIMRWSLCLQEYRFEVEPVAGRNNLFADFLSR